MTPQHHGSAAAHARATSTGLPIRRAVTLAYSGWWITGFVVWFVERQNRFVRFHAAQSVVAFGFIAILIAGFGVLAVVSLSFLPGAFQLFLWASVVTWLAGLVLWGLAMWNAASGRPWRLPLAASLADRLVRWGN